MMKYVGVWLGFCQTVQVNQTKRDVLMGPLYAHECGFCTSTSMLSDRVPIRLALIGTGLKRL